MGKITVETCPIEGLKVITPTVFGDERGYFMETYNYNDYKEAGIDQVFVQDNQSASKKGVLRGLHFQKRQGMYISCIEEIAYRRGFIDKEQLVKLAQPLLKTAYGQYLIDVANGL